MDDIFNEIQEDLRQEKILKFWRTYKDRIIGVVTALVVGGLLTTYWFYRKEQNLLSESQKFFHAITLAEKKDYAEALKILADLRENSSSSYRTLAATAQGNILKATEASKDEITRFYKELSSDERIPGAFRHIGTFVYALSKLDASEQDKILEMLSKENIVTNPVQPLIAELIAFLTYKKGDITQAQNLYKDLANLSKAAPGIKDRANIMLALLKKNQ